MVVATLCRLESVALIRRLLPGHDVLSTYSLEELTALLQGKGVDGALIDLLGDSCLSTTGIVHLRERYPELPFLVCVSFQPSALKDVLSLSRNGINSVLFDPKYSRLPDLQRALERTCSSRLSRELLKSMERTLGIMPSSLARTVEDLFDRPERYETAKDLAEEAGIRVKELYRQFTGAGLGTPKRLLTLAKLSRAYSYLRVSDNSISSVSKKLGYSRCRVLEKTTSSTLGCCPTSLGRVTDSEELVRQLLEWFYKPSRRHMSGASRRSMLAATHLSGTDGHTQERDLEPIALQASVSLSRTG
jgi:AraC-like DNA-binding protein